VLASPPSATPSSTCCPPGRIARGDIYLNGELISGKSQNEMRAIRGSRIGFIFQDPMTSLNPLFTVEQQLVETILANTDLSREAAFAKALELMGRWGSRTRTCASSSTLTSSPAACASGW
jgi:ABC-type microcin C transport system duplicated ATPase subunit YejF